MNIRSTKVKDDEDGKRATSQTPYSWLITWQRQKQSIGTRLIILVGSISLVAVILIRLFSASIQEQVSTRPQYFSLMIATSDRDDVALCKTLLSAQVLNYPVPHLIQWGNSSDGKPVRQRDRTSNKLFHMHKYLQGLPKSAEDSITILLEAPNTWFQLRPDVLLQRYFEMTRVADQRLNAKYRWDVTQKVMFASRADCSSDIAAFACEAIPDCRRRKGTKSPCLGQGAIIGSARNIRAILERAQSKLQLNATGELFELLQEIYEQQEYQREFLQRVLSRSWAARLAEKWHIVKQQSTDTIPAPSSGPMSLEIIRDTPFDFGIGLDFSSQLGSHMTGVDANWTTSVSLAEDIEASAPPFWTVSGAEPDLPSRARWHDVELFSLSSMGTVPPMLFLRSKINVRDERVDSEELWGRLWLSKHARVLYSAAERLPATSIASIVDPTGSQQVFWNRHISHNRAGAWTAAGKWIHWQDMCGADHQSAEVFRDAAGTWKRTEWY